MKPVEELLSDLCRLDIKLWVEGDRLRCNAPKGSLTPVLRSQLQERKAEILQFLHQGNSVSDSWLAPILPVASRENLPLSFAQQRLWFIDRLEPGRALYNIPTALRLKGHLDITALQQALNTLIQRHEILRTAFVVVAGQPVQAISPTVTLTFPVVDLRGLPESEREAEALRRARQEAQHPFDLTASPLLRATLLQLEETEYIALFTLHHIVADGWSMGILIQEITTLYEAFCGGQPSPLPDLPIQYADFAVWQRNWLQGNVLEAQLAYWKQQLKGDLPVLQLPVNYPRPKIQTFSGAAQSFSLSASLTEALRSLSRQEGATLFMTLLAAFKTLLYRYTGQDDLLVGSPIANRNRAEIEGLIGFFVNTLVLRTDLSGHPSFRQVLRRVRDVTVAAYAHQDLPFEKLVEELQPERDFSHTPLFQVMFVLHNAPTATLTLGDLTLSTLKQEGQTANFDLTLSMTETEEGLRGVFEYKTDLFDPARIAQMVRHFQTLLESITANGDRGIGELPLLSQAERQQQLVAWNATSADYPQNSCIQELFEAQVEKTPDAVAVVGKDRHLTYRELNERANQLAHYLRQRGIGAEIIVGLCLERSWEMLVALLGILKAGGAYLPLDLAYPPERLALMMQEAQIPLLLTQQRLLEKLPESSVEILCLDSHWERIAQESPLNSPLLTTPDHLAYVIYTSGSTGQPKGVMVQQRSLVNHTAAAMVHYEIKPSDRILQFASISFDAAAEEIFPTLVGGATLVLRTEEMLRTLPNFLQQCGELAITVLDLPTALWQQLSAELAAGSKLPESLRLVIIGGESALPESLATWQQQVGREVRLVNSYGPTEATIVATIYDLTEAIPSIDSVVPIGRPIRNVQIYLLDAHLNPVPIGVRGEIYIGGLGVARGYLNRPDLTAQKFISNPFEPGTRLYKTGDWGRYRPDGNLECIGRSDRQVKLRGFRIELGEIEAVLERSPLVREAVVLLREDEPGQPRLVAYVVPTQKQALTVGELRHFLQERLPNYMVPSAFVSLETLPLTPNGKIDRRSLPAPEPNREEEKSYVAPRTPLETKLAAIWAEILGIESVGIHDNFFELGGHSLLTTQLLARIQEAFQVDLSLRSLFDSPTIAELTQRIEQSNSTPSPISQPLGVTLATEAFLDPSIRPDRVPFDSKSQPERILLTGATGFLGAFLLFELLQQTQADIYCLVRAVNPETGWQKLRACLESYYLWQEDFRDRIVPIIGDLSEPLLGLSEEQFQQLAACLDLIYHNGAWVHHLYPYSVLKAANVLGTQEVLRLASQVKIKPVHFISTLSVFSDSGSSGIQVIKERDSLDENNLPVNGYAQSKWVAEKLVTQARDRGLPTCIYRPGRISGHSKTGVFNPNDFLYRLILGCIELKSAPVGDILLDMAPVDYVSQAIVYLSRREDSLGKAFHFLNPHPCSSNRLIDKLRSQGYPIKRVADEEWRRILLDIARNSPERALYPLVPFLLNKTPQGEASDSAVLQFDCQNTLAGLAGTAFAQPPKADELLANYFSSLINKKFLNTPPSKIQNHLTEETIYQ